MRHLSPLAKSTGTGFFVLVIFLFCLIMPGPLLAAEYGSISGTVYEADGVTPFDQPVTIQVIQGDPCAHWETVSQNTIDPASGEFTLFGVPAGQYFLRIGNTVATNAVENWWYSTGGSIHCNQAEQINLTADQELTGLAVITEQAGSISGTVTESDGVTPIAGLHVYVKSNACRGDWLGGADTDASGNYVITGIPSGTVHVGTSPQEHGQPYIAEWYDDSSGTRDCNQAFNVSVIGSKTSSGINFRLERGVAVSGRVTDTVGNPIPALWVHAFDDLCGGNGLGGGSTDGEGYYTISGMPKEDVYIEACPGCNNLNYVNSWWTGIANPNSIDCSDAQNLNLAAGVNADNVDFVLDTAGSISGTVYEADGTTPIPGLLVIVRPEACRGHWLDDVHTDENGNYNLTGLPEGKVYVSTRASHDELPFVDATYDGAGGTMYCDQGQAVDVTAGETTSGINLHLESAGSISGTVYEADGTTPIPGLQVYFRPDGCDGESAHGADTDENGHYTINGVPPGVVIVRACANCNNQPYVPVWYDNNTGTKDCAQALDVLVTANETTAGIDFNLEAGVTISGRVTDTQGNPVPDLWLHAFDNACGGNWLGGGRTDDQGNYTTDAMPTGDVFIEACPQCDDFMFSNSWWTGTGNPGSTNCSDAENLNLQTGADAVDIDFTLEYPIFVEINWTQRPDDTFDTWYGIYFFNFDNFDLDSVVSITMTGPSGTPVYQYTRADGDNDDFVGNQWNGFHVLADGVAPEVGEYTFDVVTDDFSTTFTHVRNENITMPILDAGTLSPADGSVINSRVPVFEWGSIENPQVPVYYRFQVYDDTGYRVYASGRQAGLRSMALPEGLLEPNRTYTWRVQISDTSDYTRVENLSVTESFSIIMAEDFTPRPNPPVFDLDGWGAVSWRSNTRDGTSLWLKVLDHDGIANDGSSHQVSATRNGETYSFHHVSSSSAYEATYEYWDGNTPAPEGDYVFSVTDPDGHTATATDTLVVNPLPIPDHTEFNLIPDGTSPTITWNQVPGAARYQFRIRNMNWSTIWKGYPLTTDNMTYTVPPGILQPNTSYRYQIRAWDHHYPVDIDNNATSNDIFFTTGAESIAPFIEFNSTGAATRNSGDKGTYLYFWVKVHDAQGVPDDIRSVTAAFPDGTTIPLDLESSESANRGNYYAENFSLPIAGGEYTISVEDMDGNTHSITDTLDVNPVGYPEDTTVNAVVNGTRVDVTWEEIEEAAFYRLEINDMDGNRLHNLGATQNAYTIPAGYLKENISYQYRISAWREFFDHETDNSSRSVTKVFKTASNREMDMQEVILTATDAETTIAGGDSAAVYGTAAANHITVESGAYAELVNFPGNNLIEFQSEAASFMVSRSGTVVTFQGSDGTKVKIPASTNEQTIVFNGDPFARVLRIDGHQIKLDDQVIGTEAVFISEN